MALARANASAIGTLSFAGSTALLSRSNSGTPETAVEGKHEDVAEAALQLAPDAARSAPWSADASRQSTRLLASALTTLRTKEKITLRDTYPNEMTKVDRTMAAADLLTESWQTASLSVENVFSALGEGPTPPPAPTTTPWAVGA